MTPATAAAPETRTSLHQLLLRRLVLMAMLAAVLVGLTFVLLGLGPMSARIAEDLFRTSADQVEARLNATFLPTQDLLRMGRLWIGDTPPEIDRAEPFNRLFLPMLDTLPHITSVVAGSSTGQGWLLLKQADGSLHNRLTDIPRWHDRHRIIDRPALGAPREGWLVNGYDARRRPWYTGAVTPETFHWTAPYALYTTGEPGITVSTRFKLADGRDFVLGFDIKLRDLSKATMQPLADLRAMALVLTDDRRVLALPPAPAGTPEAAWLERALAPAGQLGLASLNAALAAWPTGTEGVFGFRSDKADWLASFRPYQLGGQRLWLVALAPRAAFAPAWQPVALALAGGMLVVLLAASLIAYRQAGKLSRPLESLAGQSERISRLDFEPAGQVASNVTEVAQLATAQASMADTLKRYHQELSAQASALQESEQHFRNVTNGGSTLIWTAGTDKLCNYFNEPWLRFTGRSLAEELGDGWAAGVHPDDRERCLDTYAKAFDRRERFGMDYRLRAADGRYRWLHDDGVPRYDSAGRFIGYVGYCFDITESKQAEAALRESEHKYRQLFEAANDGIVILDGARVVDCNDRAAAMFGLPRTQIVGLTPADMSPAQQPNGRASAEIVDQITAAALNHEVQTFPWHARRGDGSLFFTEVTVNRVELDGVPLIQAILRDITERMQAEEQIRSLAYFDPLTNLPNRRLFMDRLGQALLASHRHQAHGALLILDLDNFKALNDTRGHDAGDQLLIEVAGNILACVRQNDTVARLGGDEYVVMLEGLDREEAAAARQAEMVGEKIRRALERPFGAVNHGYHVSTSIGLTLFHGRSLSPEGLLKQADVALYQAKDAGKNVIRFFNPAMQAKIDARLEMEAALRQGIENGELRLHYQPQFDHDGRLIGVEALLRWQPPDAPLIMPDRFIDLAEETGLILPIGAWVLESACAQLMRWQGIPAGRAITLAVNVSASQFRQPDFADRVAATLAATAVPAGRLKLELTESVVMDQTDAVVARMEAIRALGVGFAMDDFGTGYSSLSYLKRLPLDQLKIDRSFIRDVPGDPNDTAIVLAILAMSNSLGLDVIAEGVETAEQRDFLHCHGCMAYQGYLYSRPIPADAFDAWLAGLRDGARGDQDSG